MNNPYAPICLFVYNRPWHTQQTVEALLRNELSSESGLIVYSDGAKSDSDQIKVDEVRQYIHSINGFKTISIIESTENNGLANSIILGVTEVVKKYEKIIVLEDDLVTSPYFLRYMNDYLTLYENDDEVASIHGYVYPINNLPDTFFLKGADCWGWATWEKAWNIIELNGENLLNEICRRNIEKEINYNNSANYIKMLKDQIKGKNDSWAIRWHLSAFLKNKLVLYPGKSLIENIGHDNSGEHSITTKVYNSIMIEDYMVVKKIPTVENLVAKMKFENYFKQKKDPFLIKVFFYLLKFFKKKIV